MVDVANEAVGSHSVVLRVLEVHVGVVVLGSESEFYPFLTDREKRRRRVVVAIARVLEPYLS